MKKVISLIAALTLGSCATQHEVRKPNIEERAKAQEDSSKERINDLFPHLSIYPGPLSCRIQYEEDWKYCNHNYSIVAEKLQDDFTQSVRKIKETYEQSIKNRVECQLKRKGLGIYFDCSPDDAYIRDSLISVQGKIWEMQRTHLAEKAQNCREATIRRFHNVCIKQ